MRPAPAPLRSARTSNCRSSVPKAAPRTSGDVLPDPFASGVSLLVIDTRRIAGLVSQTSVDVTAIVTGTNWWFGGQSTDGVADRASAGGVVSFTAVETLAVLL